MTEFVRHISVDPCVYRRSASFILLFVARMERSEIREPNRSVEAVPDYAALHPGYDPGLFDITACETRAHSRRDNDECRPLIPA
jgi:hypothetical protein